MDPGQFVDTLAERLRRDGAELVEGARGTAVGEDADRVEVRTGAGTYTADAVVIAADVWSRDVCASLGVRIEMAAGTMEFDRDPDRFRQGPMTPDGLPPIGPVPGRPRILLATGHTMLGLMPAPATGRLVAGPLTREADPGLASRFAPSRSVRLRRGQGLSG